MLFTLLAMVTTRQVASAFGGDALAVQRVGSQVESLSWLIGGGFGSAVTAFVGQNYGAGKWSRIHRGFRISLASMAVWGAAVTALLFFGGRLLYVVFVPEANIQIMGADYLRILACTQIFSCFEGVTGGAFRGVGKSVPPAVVSIVNNVIRVPLAYALASVPSLGLNGIWWAITITASLRGVLSLAWYVLFARGQPKVDVEIGGGEPAPEAGTP
jgi:Na+-driven multidrug efflux pump